MLKKNIGFWTGIVILGFSIICFVTSFQYKYIILDGPGPGLLPRWATIMLMLLTCVYIYNSISNPVLLKDIMPEKKIAIENLLIMLYMVLFIVIVRYTGFVIALTIMLFLLFREQFRWFIALAVAGGSSVALFLLFDVMLKVPLPVNTFGW